MSVIVRAYSNHGLKIHDYPNGVSVVENRLNIRIENQSRSGLAPTDDEAGVVYFTNHEYFSQRFNERGEIWIFSNFRICDQIRIYKHFIDFSLSGRYNLKTHIWRDLISGKTLRENEDFKNEISEALSEWKRTREYVHLVTKKLSGHLVIYINDGSSGLGRGEGRFGTVKA